MSYTARPSFTGGAGQNQQQQRGQPNNASNNQTGGIPNMAMMNNAAAAAAAMQSNSMSSTSATSVQPTIDYQKLFQQHFQTQLLGKYHWFIIKFLLFFTKLTGIFFLFLNTKANNSRKINKPQSHNLSTTCKRMASIYSHNT